MIFTKKDNKQPCKEVKPRVYKVNTHKKMVIALWILLAASFCFAVYKNFTAIDIHTIHETTVVEERVIDTHKIESFVKDFAAVYYAWEQSAESIDTRMDVLKGYLTEELYAMSADTIRKDIPVSSSVQGVRIWAVSQASKNQFDVTFTVDQLITEGEARKTVRSAYKVSVYVDNMVLIKSPTITSVPGKSNYVPKAAESNGSVDSVSANEIIEFLTTFFKLYPTATAKELSYYVNDGALKPIGKDYIFAELMNPIYNRSGNQVVAALYVKYLDEQTKAIQVSQFDLVLEKSGNWKIVK